MFTGSMGSQFYQNYVFNNLHLYCHQGGNGINRLLILTKIKSETELSQSLTLINDYFFRNVLTVLTSMMGIQSMT